MKLKENFKRFWTLSKNRKGFTLVELIVVIAILAILAGVAIPVYNGYIKKAETAADQQLVDSINTAFAAACLSEGVNHETVVASVAIDADGRICQQGADGQYAYAITITDAKGANADDIMSNFAMFYAGNETAAFKGEQFVGLNYPLPIVTGEGAAAGAYSGLLAILTNGSYSSQIAALKNSIFMNDEKGLGTEGLLNKVGDVTKFAAGANSAALNSILNSPEFFAAAGESMGLDSTDPEFTNKLLAQLDSLSNEMVAKNPGMSKTEAENQVKANAAVLYAAQNTTSMTVNDVVSLLGKDGAKATITGNLSTNSGTAMSQAAVAYGMYTAYAYSTGDADLIASTEDPIKILNGLNDNDFQAYINSDAGKADVEGYLSAMTMVNEGAGDSGAVNSMMLNGFSDPQLAAVLNQLAGK